MPKERSVLTLVVAMMVCLGVFWGCQKQEDAGKDQTGSSRPVDTSLGEKPVMPNGNIMPMNAQGKFPEEMMQALQRPQMENAGAVDKRSPLAGPMGEKNQVPLVVPPEVRDTWKAVVLEVVNKETGDQKDHVVEIDKDFVIPDTQMKVHVLTFLPDFAMSRERITSRSNEPKNPAAKIAIHDGKSKVFESWLFQNMPTLHPFKHNVYAIRLKGAKP